MMLAVEVGGEFAFALSVALAIALGLVRVVEALIKQRFFKGPSVPKTAGVIHSSDRSAIHSTARGVATLVKQHEPDDSGVEQWKGVPQLQALLREIAETQRRLADCMASLQRSLEKHMDKEEGQLERIIAQLSERRAS